MTSQASAVKTQTRWFPILGRTGAFLIVLAYVATTVWFAACHAVGDPEAHPVAYLFTWDMFPFYYTESSRRVAVARTDSGKFLELLPSGLQQYRGGVRGDLTRFDLDRSGRLFRIAARDVLRLAPAAHGADPVAEVALFERYWPAKFNYPADLYESWSGEPHPQRRYWRLREQFSAGESPKSPAPRKESP